MTSSLAGVLVLLVDDDADVRDITCRILERVGCIVVAASSPLRAAELFESDPTSAQVLVTDIVMPDMSGPQLAARLRLTSPDLPVLLLSGYDHNTLAAGRPSGTAVLAKPFEGKVLVDTIMSLIGTDGSVP